MHRTKLVSSLAALALALGAAVGMSASAVQAAPKVAFVAAPDSADPAANASKALAPSSKLGTPPVLSKPTAPKGVYSLKGAPAKRVGASPRSGVGCPCFYYNVGSQGFPVAGITPTGTFSNVSLISPTLDTADGHSLAEVAAQKTTSTGLQQTVEVGVTVDRVVNPDAQPRLFVYHWVNNNGTCYNGCGYVDNGAVTTNVGDVISSSKYLGIEYFASGSGASPGWWYWISANNGVCNAGDNTCGWFGYVPDSVYTGATPAVTNFNNEDLSQVFGEGAFHDNVAGANCSDIGSPVLATSTAGASFGSVQHVGLTVAQVNMFARVNPSGIGAYWNVVPLGTVGNTRSWRYGGPGGVTSPCPNP